MSTREGGKNIGSFIQRVKTLHTRSPDQTPLPATTEDIMPLFKLESLPNELQQMIWYQAFVHEHECFQDKRTFDEPGFFMMSVSRRSQANLIAGVQVHGSWWQKKHFEGVIRDWHGRRADHLEDLAVSGRLFDCCKGVVCGQLTLARYLRR
jgi:hypothetical protein